MWSSKKFFRSFINASELINILRAILVNSVEVKLAHSFIAHFTCSWYSIHIRKHFLSFSYIQTGNYLYTFDASLLYSRCLCCAAGSDVPVVVVPHRVCPSTPAPLKKSKQLAGECHRSSSLLMLCCVLMWVSAGQWVVMCVRQWVPVLQCVQTVSTESSILFR